VGNLIDRIVFGEVSIFSMLCRRPSLAASNVPMRPLQPALPYWLFSFLGKRKEKTVEG